MTKCKCKTAVVVSNEVALLRYLSTFFKYLYFTGVVLFWVTFTFTSLHYIPEHKIILFTSLHFIKHIVTSYNTSRAPRRRSGVWLMNKLIIFNEPVQPVRKSQQMIHSRMGMIQLQLFASRQLTDSNESFRASLQCTDLTRNNREIARASNAAKSKLQMSNFWNWKSYLGQNCQLFVN